MKKGIHPDFHVITVHMTDGTTFETMSTYGEPNAHLHLDIDPKSHPAWNPGSRTVVDRVGRIARFKERFSEFSVATTSSVVSSSPKNS